MTIPTTERFLETVDFLRRPSVDLNLCRNELLVLLLVLWIELKKEGKTQ